MLLVAATLSACGGDAPGPAAQAFNKERQVIDARNAAAVRTRMVKPPRAVNGGYAALPGEIRPQGETAGAAGGETPRGEAAGEAPRKDAPVAQAATATMGKGYLVQPASKEPPVSDPAREAAVRRIGEPSKAELGRRIAVAEARRKAIVAAQTKRIAEGKTGRRQDLRKADLEAFKHYRPPVKVQPAPAKGSGAGVSKPRAGATTTPAPRATGTVKPQTR